MVSTAGETRLNTKLSNWSLVEAGRGTVSFPTESTSAYQVIRGPSPDSTDPRATLARESATTRTPKATLPLSAGTNGAIAESSFAITVT